MDGFDRLPDCLVADILNAVSDVKSLACCRAVSKRFNSLVPGCHSLILRVDRVTSADSDFDPDFVPKPISSASTADAITRVLRGFEQIRDLEIELPTSDMRLEKGVFVNYRAVFGADLESCVIFGFRHARGGGGGSDQTRRPEDDYLEGLRERVKWILMALVDALARHHYLARIVAMKHGDLARLVLRDADGQGEVSMDARGLRELKTAMEMAGSGLGSGSDGRSVIPAPTGRMRVRQEGMLRIQGGEICLERPTLVVVRPNGAAAQEAESDGRDEAEEDAELALRAFGSGMYGDAVRALLKKRSYSFETNSF